MEMIQAAVQVLLGLVLVFSGANIFRGMPPLGGFIIGGLIFVNLAGALIKAPPGYELWYTVGAFVIGGLIGALIAIPLHVVIYVLTGISLGVLAGAVLGFIINQQGITRMIIEGIPNIAQISGIQATLMALLGVAFGLLAVRYDEIMIAASTGFLGSLITVSGLAVLSVGTAPLFRNELFLGFLWFTLGLLGWIWQNYHQEE
jgi:hypothetical protein